MINVFFYSIAGKKTNKVIDELVDALLGAEFVPANEKKVLNHVKEVALHGNYPDPTYFSTFYPQPEFTYRSLAEISDYVTKTLDFYHTQSLQRSVLKTINESENYPSLYGKLSRLLEGEAPEVEAVNLKPSLYSDTLNKPVTQGILTGISEIDNVTNGLQPANIATVAAFTGHGKSTTVDSILFKNALLGKKCCLVSLELAPNIVWAMLQARYLYECKGLSVTSQDLIFHKVPSDLVDKVVEYEDDFKREICENLTIIDESYISKFMMLDYHQFSRFVGNIAKQLGGLDLIAFDHVGQFELLYEDCGNRIIKSIQSFTKTFKDQRDVSPVTIFACQCNREGEKRARKRNYCYDLQAISDLNEVERSSSYVIFMYTSDDMKVVQETKMTLAKHRLGNTITEPVTVSFNPAISTVGSSVEKISMSDDDFNNLDISFSDDEF